MRKLLLTRDQAGDLLGLSERTIKRRIAVGLIAIREDDKRIPLKEVLRYAVQTGILDKAAAKSLYASAVEHARSDVLEVIG